MPDNPWVHVGPGVFLRRHEPVDVSVGAIVGSYRGKNNDKTNNTIYRYRSASAASLNHGALISMPSALASLLRATAQPSLLESTITGRTSSVGSKARSHET